MKAEDSKRGTVVDSQPLVSLRPAASALPPETLRATLEAAVVTLAPLYDTARLDAEVLLGHVLKQPRHRPYAWPEQPVDSSERARFMDLIARRAEGEPVAYLTEHREFWSLALEVSPDTLIPRPETECLVEAALARIPPRDRWRVADLGTGSGAVALALASERPGLGLIATEISRDALRVAERNALRLGIANVEFRLGDWCAALSGERFKVIVSNPPYVAEGDPYLRQGDLRYEPERALKGGPDGLAAIRRIAEYARFHLADGGRLILEHGHDQGAAVRKLLEDLGYREVQTHLDYAGHERVAEAVATR